MRWIVLLTLTELLGTNITLASEFNSAQPKQNEEIKANEKLDYLTAKKLTYGIYAPRPFEHLKKDTSNKKAIENVGSIILVDGSPTKVIKIINQNNCIIAIDGDAFWLANYPTKDINRGESIRIIDKLEYIGINKYAITGTETKSIKTLQLVPKDLQELLFEKQFRLYTFHSQTERIDVLYFDVNSNNFVGQRPDYSEVKFEYGQLTSDADKKFLKSKIHRLTSNAPPKLPNP